MEKLLLIKGPFCFVFKNEKDLAPKYAISLAHLKAKKQPSSEGISLTVVTLETGLGDVEYEVRFLQENIFLRINAGFFSIFAANRRNFFSNFF